MRTIMNITILTTLLITSSTFAQQGGIDSKILAKSSQIKRLVQKSINILTHQEKQQINKILSQAVGEINSLIDGGISTTPRPPQSNLSCSWKDGQSSGISQRGHHLIERVRGLQISKQYFGNNGVDSSAACLRVLIDLTVHPSEITRAKRATCTCKWMAGETENQPSQRGIHKSYTLPVQNGARVTYMDISTAYFGNNGVISQQKCQNELVATNFSCR